MSKNNTLLDFRSRILKTDNCWLWTGTIHKQSGYGKFSLFSHEWRAHVLSYYLHHGPVKDGQEVCHKCDNPKCVNPDHLFAATHKENMEDMSIKGRASRGEKVHTAKFSEADVLKIRSLYLDGVNGVQLSKMYKTSHSNIYNILNGKRWTHI